MMPRSFFYDNKFDVSKSFIENKTITELGPGPDCVNMKSCFEKGAGAVPEGYSSMDGRRGGSRRYIFLSAPHICCEGAFLEPLPGHHQPPFGVDGVE